LILVSFGSYSFGSFTFQTKLSFHFIPVISCIVVFSSFGSNVIVVIASLLSVDRSIIEAATMDGASWWRIKYSILLPMIGKTVWLISLLTAIAAMQIFETIYALAPYEYSATMAFHIYRQGFQWSKYGLASAQATILLAITVSLTLLKNRMVDHEA
jgi:multiple sugar transport system permease protein